jgi:hypothetical protein
MFRAPAWYTNKKTNRQTDRKPDEQTKKQTDTQTERQTFGPLLLYKGEEIMTTNSPSHNNLNSNKGML